jgi:hypothetical protein
MRLRLLIICLAALTFVGGAAARTAVNVPPPAHIPRFWLEVAHCETGGRWDWGKYADTSARRPGEGTTFEGGLGFYASTWTLWRTEIHVGYDHAWQAPPLVQVKVAAWGLEHGGYWGCLHDGSVDPSDAPSYSSIRVLASAVPPEQLAVTRVARVLESL